MSDIGLTPSNDGKIIRLIFPELTTERRQNLAKGISKRLELDLPFDSYQKRAKYY